MWLATGATERLQLTCDRNTASCSVYRTRSLVARPQGSKLWQKLLLSEVVVLLAILDLSVLNVNWTSRPTKEQSDIIPWSVHYHVIVKWSAKNSSVHIAFPPKVKVSFRPATSCCVKIIGHLMCLIGGNACLCAMVAKSVQTAVGIDALN